MALPKEVYDEKLPARTRAWFEKADAKNAAMAAKVAKAAKDGDDVD